MPAKFLFICFLFLCPLLHAQTDSVRLADSTLTNHSDTSSASDTAKRDTLVAAPKMILLNWQQDTAFNRFFINYNLPRNKQSVFAINAVRRPAQQDEQFYILAGLLLFTGIIRAAFPKYFASLLQSFLQSSQRQSKESNAQDVLPSFLMNIVFVLSAGLLLAAFVKGDDFAYRIPFALLWVYASGVLAIIYIVKTLFISFLGWSFNAEEPASNYKYIVFVVNKIAGLCFLPLLLILLYATDGNFTIVSTLAVVLIVILLLYRYIVSLNMVGKRLKINPLHFFLYLCAVEILPLLITYKVLLITKELHV